RALRAVVSVGFAKGVGFLRDSRTAAANKNQRRTSVPAGVLLNIHGTAPGVITPKTGPTRKFGKSPPQKNQQTLVE
ncbi:MAG: hypothetical protein JWQ71_2152, partial [Pedosphaera sp.]|nr:hypothetical protein [Pedosphaera sp.]